MTEAENKISALESFGLKNNSGEQVQLKTILHASGMAALSTLLLREILRSFPGYYSNYPGNGKSGYEMQRK
jgi:methionine-gamma-lyase